MKMKHEYPKSIKLEIFTKQKHPQQVEMLVIYIFEKHSDYPRKTRD